jgi:hypothetical protein
VRERACVRERERERRERKKERVKLLEVNTFIV